MLEHYCFLSSQFTLSATINVEPIIPMQRRKPLLVSMDFVLMTSLRANCTCCCQMFCSPQWQQYCCTWRSLGRVPVRCLGQCVWCCCWVPCTARLCRRSPAGGPRAVQLPAAPPALCAEGGGFSRCQAPHAPLLSAAHAYLLAQTHCIHKWTLRPWINLKLFCAPSQFWSHSCGFSSC